MMPLVGPHNMPQDPHSQTLFALLHAIISHPQGIGLLHALMGGQPNPPQTLQPPTASDQLPAAGAAPAPISPRFQGDLGKGQDVPLADVSPRPDYGTKPKPGVKLPGEVNAPADQAAPMPTVPMGPDLMSILRAIGGV